MKPEADKTLSKKEGQTWFGLLALVVKPLLSDLRVLWCQLRTQPDDPTLIQRGVRERNPGKAVKWCANLKNDLGKLYSSFKNLLRLPHE